jgi:hypothetical protein
MEFYTKKQVQNTILIKRTFSIQEADQDPRTSDICNMSKNPTKPTYNIEIKTNNTTLVANPKLNAKQF